MTQIAGSKPGSGSISQRHGCADPDPPQNVMDPQHWMHAAFLEDKVFTLRNTEIVFYEYYYRCWKANFFSFFWTNQINIKMIRLPLTVIKGRPQSCPLPPSCLVLVH
jgi:hypothetical protein